MNHRRFFAFVWRVNAVLILLVGVLAAVVLIMFSYLFFKDATRTRAVDDVANLALGDIDKQSAEIGAFHAVPGVAVLRAPLRVQETYALGAGSKEAGSTRNYLHFDPSSKSAYWLKPSMEGVILQSEQLPKSEYGQPEPDAVAFGYVSVERDSNGDSRLTATDVKTIAMSDASGRNYRTVVEQADRLNDARLIAPDRMLILYSVGTRLAAVEVNPQQPSAPMQAYDVITGAK